MTRTLHPAYQGNEPYVFVCYAHRDAYLVDDELARLRDDGVNVWYDEGISPGSIWRDELAHAIHNASLLLFFVSPNAVASEHCLREVSFALDRDCPIVPVYLSATELPAGLQLALAHRQAIAKYKLDADTYARKLKAALGTLVGHVRARSNTTASATSAAMSRVPIGASAAPHAAESHWPAHEATQPQRLLNAIRGVWKARGSKKHDQLPVDGQAPSADVSNVALPHAHAADDHQQQRARAAPPRLLVLPIAGTNRDDDDDFFVDGLTEDIVTGLSKSPWLVVFDSGTSFSFKGQRTEPRAIASEVGAAYVVHGTMRRSASRLRASLYLVDVDHGATLWSEQFDCAVDEMFAMYERIKLHVIGAIEPASLQNESTAAQARTKDLAQWELVMKARYLFWKTSRKTTAEARRLLEQALAIDADDSRAWGLLAMAHLNDVWHGWSGSPAASLQAADHASREAVRADNTDAWAHHTRSAVTTTMGNLDQAEADLRRALTLNPHLAAALGDMTHVLALAGKTEGAIAFAERAMEASPRDQHLGLWCCWIALVHFVDANYEQALPWLDQASAARPDWGVAPLLRAACMAWLGQTTAAEQLLEALDINHYRLKPDVLRAAHPFRDPRHLARYLEGLHRAGWHEAPDAAATAES